MRKKWYEKRLRKNDKMKTTMAAILKMYGVKYRFKVLPVTAGYAWPNKGQIAVNTRTKSVGKFVGCCFHELAHVMNFVNGKYKNYHTITNPHMSLKRRIEICKAIVHTGIHAEVYTDKLGAKLCKIHFPDMKYHVAYRSKDDRKWFKKWMTDPTNKALKQLVERKRSKCTKK